MNLTVIIPSKQIQNLVNCVAAIRRNEPTLKIIVVNDGIDLARIARFDRCWLCEHDPIEVIEGVKPFIFARNINLGIQAAGRSDVVLMNDDALLEVEGGLSKLQHQGLLHPECGLISSSVNAAAACQCRQFGNGMRFNSVMVAFVCVFIPRTTIDRLGLLDERFGVGAGGTGVRGYGCEDDDLCWRVREAGMKLGIYDGCFVDHMSLKSTFRDDPDRPADVVAHELVFAEKWGRSPRNP